MLLKRTYLIFTFILFLSPSSWATGDEKENGGDILECGEGSAKTFELLDLYEAKALYKFEIASVQGKSIAEIFEERLSSLDRINPARSRLYRQYFLTFQSEARFVPDSDFSDVPDEGFKPTPKGCELKQIVVQYDRPTPEGIRYIVNQDLWDHLSAEHQAALLLHEFIYREGRLPQNSFQTSSGVRMLNALIHSTKMKDLKLEVYFKYIRKVGLQEVEAQGVPIVLFNWDQNKTKKIPQEVLFFPNGLVESATLANHFIVPGRESDNEEVLCRTEILNEHNVAFFEDGKIAQLNVGCQPIGFTFYSKAGRGYIYGTSFSYSHDGSIFEVAGTGGDGSVFDYQTAPFSIMGLVFSNSTNVSVLFYPNGSLRFVESSSFQHWHFFREGIEDVNFWKDIKGKISFTEEGLLQDPQ